MTVAQRIRPRRAGNLSEAAAPPARPRLFLLDPVCVLPFGHNVPSLNYYRTYLAGRFDVVGPFVCRHLPDTVRDAAAFVRHFGFYYHDFIRIDAARDAAAAGALAEQARRDVAALFAAHDLGAGDRVLVPSADYHLVRALLDVLRRRPAAQRPRVFLRFIGVMEGASRDVADPFDDLLDRMRCAIADGLPISLAAETPAYADLLSVRIGRPVALVPYPLIGEQLPLPPPRPLRIYSAGSGRFDKGFMDLLAIARSVACSPLAGQVEFAVQLLPDAELRNVQSYASQLYACPGVTLLPAILTGAEIVAQYRQSHAVIMPYDADIYRLRGSAILMEALAYGRHVFTGDGTAFAAQVRYYGNGAVCRTTEEYVAAIAQLAAAPVQELAVRLGQARARFSIDTDAAYRNWIT